jgi:3-hydroxyacyl-[acyl-carrier-protein] dehydratase
MKLINDFYHIVSKQTTEEGYACKVSLNERHPFYSVHFPGNPVTPGVCLLQIATEILEHKYNRRLLLTKAANIKFKRLVAPDDQPTFVFSKILFQNDCLKTLVSIEDRESQFVKMSLQYTTVDGQ